MLGLTPLGIVHTAISLVAVTAGLIALVRDQRITLADTLGKTDAWTTVLTCVTGFGIFQHGGFGKPHMLGIITLLVLGVPVLAVRTTWFGRASPCVERVSCPATFLFHLIPAITVRGRRLFRHSMANVGPTVIEPASRPRALRAGGVTVRRADPHASAPA